MDGFELLCDGRCGGDINEFPHYTHQCSYRGMWEQTDLGNGNVLTWIYKICGNCCQSRMHYLAENAIDVICMDCIHTEKHPTFTYLHGPYTKQSVRILYKIRKYDDSIRTRIANGLGDQLIEDMIPKPPIRTKSPYFQEAVIAGMLKNPWFESCNKNEKVYKMGNRFLLGSMFTILYNVPEHLEYEIQQANRMGMDLEDRKGCLRFVGETEWSITIAMLNISQLDKDDPSYFWNGARAFIQGKWRNIAPNGTMTFTLSGGKRKKF